MKYIPTLREIILVSVSIGISVIIFATNLKSTNDYSSALVIRTSKPSIVNTSEVIQKSVMIPIVSGKPLITSPTTGKPFNFMNVCTSKIDNFRVKAIQRKYCK